MAENKTEEKKDVVENVIDVPQPDATIDLDSKIYLAVAPDSTAKNMIIHTLACFRQGGNYYDMVATHEMNIFKDPKVAHLFYNAVKKITKQNKTNKKWQWMYDWNKDEIKKFNAERNMFTKLCYKVFYKKKENQGAK